MYMYVEIIIHVHIQCYLLDVKVDSTYIMMEDFTLS